MLVQLSGAGHMTKNQKINFVVFAVLMWTFVATICRAIRKPNDYAEAYWLLNYQFGFMKRGLIGSICSTITDLLDLQMNSMIITILSVITLSSMFAALLFVYIRIFRYQQSKNSILVIGLLFVSSPFVVMNAHLLGYSDALLYCFVVTAVSLVFSNHPLLAAIVSSIALLTNESYFLIGFPLVCLASVGVLTADSRRTHWRRHLVAISIPLAVFLAIPLLQALTTDTMTLRSQLIEYLDSFGFVSSRSKLVGKYQTTTSWEFFRHQNGYFVARLLKPTLLASFAPTVLAILVFIHSTFRIRVLSPFSIMLMGVVFAPLAMHAVAFDSVRISTYTIGGAFITLWILAEVRTAQDTNDLFMLTALPVLILNIFGRIPLMDGELERFSDTLPLLIYLPAILFFLTVVSSKLKPRLFKEFTQERISNKAINCNKR